ncbi:winged helix-turn-helix domain-containing protein [Geodermatophilus sabuli]|uniref:DNA-binding transcriptional regulator, MarR family n=1 Tax=Geodermatophilus sabuli TaxID=1564158 RepID=A0A285ECH9_9ACTN|nr:transcriptional regulator [Geodermatophilus sabuli]MBB3083438.1 DNA-binding MarR family transcriptional regulator [Geodermatophilus sabuli]SNX96842.1 DNA-binding transcriptional regulator, MarR family [Geodermatophilus sabuli]
MSGPRGVHPRHELDELIHAPVRFSVMATLASADEAEFGFVRDGVQVSDSMLSKTVSALEKAGYVEVRKGYVGKRPRTWLRLSRRGREAFGAHVAALRAIADGAVPPAQPGTSR